MQTFQGTFTAGELAPSLLGRVDLARYDNGCKTLENMLVHPQGGASKRPGLEMVAELPGEAHLVPFVFNNEQSYVLAFTEKELNIREPVKVSNYYEMTNRDPVTGKKIRK